MKRHHRLQGYEWSDQLELAHSAFVQSTLRGIGPGKQSSPLPFAKLADVDLNTELVHDDFPVLPGCACVPFTYFLLRELERATAELADMTLDRDRRTVRMHLSVSKNDPRALAAQRTRVILGYRQMHPHRTLFPIQGHVAKLRGSTFQLPKEKVGEECAGASR